MMSRQFLLDIIGCLREEVATHFARRLSSPQRESFAAYVSKLFDYTVCDGKFGRSRLTLNTFKALAPNATEKEVQRAARVAASIEVLQSFFLVMDDIVDQSHIRRGKPCWHRLPEVGLKANVDGLLLESSVNVIVRRELQHHPRLHSVLASIDETKADTVIGQKLDCDTTRFVDFNWQLYREIVDHKTSNYTYYFPLSLGFHLADEWANVAALREIAYKLGYLFQAQDDYLDAFGDVTVTGKSSNDFADSKCTWVSCRLLERIANQPDKMDYIVAHFGLSDPTHIEAVRQMALDERVDADFRRFQERSVDALRTYIATFPMPTVRQVLRNALDEITDRQK